MCVDVAKISARLTISKKRTCFEINQKIKVTLAVVIVVALVFTTTERVEFKLFFCSVCLWEVVVVVLVVAVGKPRIIIIK